MGQYHVTESQLKEAVAVASSLAGAMRILEIPLSGGQHRAVSRRVRNMGLDISHFVPSTTGQPGRRKTAEEILCRLPAGSRRAPAYQLRRALLEIGVAYECALAPDHLAWMGHELVLQIDHIDGDWLNNLRENLRFLCPNCHSQTENYAGRSQGGRKWTCGECESPTTAEAVRCRPCAARNRPAKIDWPPRTELEGMLARSNYSVVARALGVSDNAVRKHLRRKAAV